MTTTKQKPFSAPAEAYEEVYHWAKVCLQHLYSSDKKSPHSKVGSVAFSKDELEAAIDAGEDAIAPLIKDFRAVAVAVPMPQGGKGVGHLDSSWATCAHGCAFRAARRLLRGKRPKIDADAVEDAWKAMQHEQQDIAGNLVVIDSAKNAADIIPPAYRAFGKHDGVPLRTDVVCSAIGCAGSTLTRNIAERIQVDGIRGDIYQWSALVRYCRKRGIDAAEKFT